MFTGIHLIWICRFETENKAWIDITIFQHGHNDRINLPVWGSPGRARYSLLMLDKVPPSLYVLCLHVLLSLLASFFSAHGTFDLCSFHEWTFFFFKWMKLFIADERVRSTGRDCQSSPSAHKLLANHRQAGWLMLKVHTERRRPSRVVAAHLWFRSVICILQQLWH